MADAVNALHAGRPAGLQATRRRGPWHRHGGIKDINLALALIVVAPIIVNADTSASSQPASPAYTFMVATSTLTPTPTLAPTLAPTPTPTPTLAPTLAPTPTPTPTLAPTPTPKKTPPPKPRATAAPKAAATPAPTPAPTDAATPAPTDAATPAPTDAPTPAPTDAPTPAPTTFKDYVYNGTPNVQQHWNYTCAAASVQTELAMALGSFDTSSVEQMVIYNWGCGHLGFALPAAEPGLDPYSWAEALNNFSGGAVHYKDAAYSTGQAGLQAIAKNMLATGHPQGVDVHKGTHAWTIIGFTADADPSTSPDFSVTGVYVAAPYIAWTDPKIGTYYSANTFINSIWGRYYEPAGKTQWTGSYAAVVGG